MPSVVEFREIRPYGVPGGRADGFEELTSILIRDGLVDWPEGTVFQRFGNPDGGREGQGVLPNGDVWAWQAKYVFGFGASEIGQVTKSVLRALDTEPNLKRYYVTLPYDLPAGDTATRKSAHTRWLEKKAEWEALATARGMTVEFVYLGAHDLLSELTKPHQAGRLRYWFDASTLSPDAMKQRLADVVAKAGRRYSPAVHVEVETVRALEGLGRTDAYLMHVQVALAGLRALRSEGWYPPDDEEMLREGIMKTRERLLAAELAVAGLLEALRSGEPLPEISEELTAADAQVEVVTRLLRDQHLRDGRYLDRAGALYGTLNRSRQAVRTTRSLLKAPETQAAQSGRLLLTGRAGTGKTHLFCDVASRRIADGSPTLIVLGQDFDGRPLLRQIGDLVQLDGTLDEVLAVLDAAGEVAGRRALLMIDALNEGTNAERWSDDLRVLAQAVDRHPHVMLAVSCRTEFVAPVVGDANGFPRVAHHGFAEATAAAVDRYTAEYNLERLTFPVLNPEYGNPLFLKLACEALSTLGVGRFTLGSASLTTVCDAFLAAVNKRLAGPTRCDYDEATDLVQTVVRELATVGPGPYNSAVVRRITESLLQGRPWSKSLLLGLKREGVLMDTFDNQLAFSYQRLGDVARAMFLAEQSAEELKAWYAGLGNRRWAEQGTIGALAVIAPERLGAEIVDLFKDGRRIARDLLDAFVESLVLRGAQHTTDRTVRIVQRLLELDEWTDRTWEQLVRLACVPGHRLNADWLHSLLTARPLPERDATWSEWLVGGTSRGADSAVIVLLDWAGHPDRAFTDDTVRLASLVLGWMLAASDRRVRDRATKALAGAGERAPTGFAAAVRSFRGCDDPYVVERLAAAVCAVALRASDPTTVVAMAEAASDLVADGWPEHLLTRDYLRRTLQAARGHGWDGPDGSPPYGATWPVEAMSAEAIAQRTAGSAYRTIWRSLQREYGDFGQYEMGPALERFGAVDRDLVERAVFSRVVELGWTAERFGRLDADRRGGHDGPVERYGKKYQWIGFYEVLGRLADTYQVDGLSPYEFPEQVVWRDLDPTVLAPAPQAWYQPVRASFPSEVTTEYPRDLSGVPDPLDLIAHDPEWLTLVRHSSATQDLPPEIAALQAPILNIWIQVRGYLVPAETAAAVRDFAAGQDSDGRWMPENVDVHSRLLAAHPSAPDWGLADGTAEPGRPRRRDDPQLFQPIAWYGGTGTSRGSAGGEEPTGYVPSRLLYDALELNHGVDFRWTDDGGLAVVDPTAGSADASTLLMRRELVGRLAGKGYTLFWTVLLNKQLNDRSYNRQRDKVRWISASASYLLTGDTIELVSAQASRRRPGGEAEPVEWVVRNSG
ncbi:hypothetical protein AB0E69_39385 [Kribbella sp. NPDC026611]|uniref:NACHT domain-containing protein n=1 Tax=Kribbella sp. NPDC026611 TaxID=3154911 RepID=UPI0033D1639D